MKVRTRKLAVFATCLGIAGAFPVLSSADRGGIPHNNKPCPSKAKGKGPKKPAPNNKGKKCGFKRGTTTTVAPTTSTETTVPTTTTVS